MPKFLFFVTLFLFFNLFRIKLLFAANISNSNPSLDSFTDFNQELELDTTLNINAEDNTKYYLRGLFFKSGTNKYCGFTWNGQNWYNGPYGSSEGWKNLPSLYISSGSGTQKLKLKLDPNDKDCTDQGDYGFKVQRYTESGSSSIDEQNELKILVKAVIPSDTPKPENTKSPNPIPSLTKTKSIQTPTNQQNSTTVLPTLTVITINSASISSISDYTLVPDNNNGITNVQLEATVAGISKKKFIELPLISLILASLLIFYSAFLAFIKVKKTKG